MVERKKKTKPNYSPEEVERRREESARIAEDNRLHLLAENMINDFLPIGAKSNLPVVKKAASELEADLAITVYEMMQARDRIIGHLYNARKELDAAERYLTGVNSASHLSIPLRNDAGAIDQGCILFRCLFERAVELEKRVIKRKELAAFYPDVASENDMTVSDGYSCQ